jgi:hypothetical protein
MKNFKYLTIVNGKELEKSIDIPNHIFNKIYEKYGDSTDDFILSKIKLHQWDFDNSDTHNMIINELEII